MPEARDATEWILELIDKVTGPASKAGKAVADVTRKLLLSERAVKSVTKTYKALGDAMRKGMAYSADKARFALDRLHGAFQRIRTSERLAAAASRAATAAGAARGRLATMLAAGRGGGGGTAARYLAAGAGFAATQWGRVRGFVQSRMPTVATRLGAAGGWLGSRTAGAREWAGAKLGEAGRTRVGRAVGALGKGSLHQWEGATMGLTALYKVASGQAFSTLAENLRVIADKFHMVLTLSKAAAAGVAVAAVTLTKKTLDYAVFADSAKRTLTNLAGGEAGGDEAYTKAVELSRTLGIDIHTAVDGMKELLAAQFKIGQAEELIKLSADLKDVTGDAQAAQRALLAMVQIKAKGKLQGQELTMQLSNAGLSTRLVYEELAKHYKISVEQAIAKVSKGEVDADVGLGAIKSAIMRKLHEHAPGEAAAGYVEHTIAGLTDRLKAAPGLLLTRVAEAANNDLMAVKPALRDILHMFDSIDVSSLAKVVSVVAQSAASIFALARAFYDGFVLKLPQVVESLTAFRGGNYLNFARQMGTLFAELLAYMIRIARVAVNIGLWINDNRWVIYLWAGAKALGVLWGLSKAIFYTLYAFHGLKWVFSILSILFSGGGTAGLAASLGAASGHIAKGMGWLLKLPIVGEVLGHILFMLKGTALVFGGLSLAIGALIVLWYNWDDIVEATNSKFEEMLGWIANIVDAFDKLWVTVFSGKTFTEAGWEAAKNFVTAFINGIIGIAQSGMDLFNPLYWADKYFGTDMSGARARSANSTAASITPAWKYSDNVSNSAFSPEQWKAMQSAMSQRGVRDVNIEVNVGKEGEGDPHQHGQVIADQIQATIRQHFALAGAGFY